MDQKRGSSAQKERLIARISRLQSLLWGIAAIAWLAGPVQSENLHPPLPVAPLQTELSNPVTVQHVIDGDTIKLASGEKVRYIGIDSPEMRRRVGTRWVTVNEPFAREAYQFNRSLVEGKPVRLEKDIESTDRYGRMLAYVYVEDHTTGTWILANAELLRAGLARVMVIPPNRRYEDRFRTLEGLARSERVGLWKSGMN
jgi:endonuclease YncB( thermonuclease family)